MDANSGHTVQDHLDFRVKLLPEGLMLYDRVFFDGACVTRRVNMEADVCPAVSHIYNVLWLQIDVESQVQHVFVGPNVQVGNGLNIGHAVHVGNAIANACIIS